MEECLPKIRGTPDYSESSNSPFMNGKVEITEPIENQGGASQNYKRKALKIS